MAFGSAIPAAADEYYVVKTKSGAMRVVDHKPMGRATIVKGPFKTMEEAHKAFQPPTETKAPDPKP